MKSSLASWLTIVYSCSALVHLAAEESTPVANSDPVSKAHTSTPLWDVTYRDEHKWVEAVSRRRQNIESAAQAVVVLSQDDLLSTPAPNLVQRLRYEAGIDVYQSRGSQFDIGIRGFAGLNSPRIIAQIDGRDFDMFDITGIPTWIGVLHPTDIIRTEIIKGPGSVLYGANAFGGIIAIKDRDVADFYELHTLVQMGSDGQREVDATALGPLHLNNRISPFYFKISAGMTQRDDINAPKGLEPGPHVSRSRQNDDDDMRTQRSSILLGSKLANEHRLELEFYQVNIREWDWIEDYAVGSNNISVKQTTLGIRLLAPWGEARYLRYDNASFYSNSIVSYNPASDFRYTQAYIDSTSDLFRSHVNHKFNNHFITVGIEFERWESNSNFWSKVASIDDPSSYATVTTYNRGVFIEDQWEPNAQWTLSAGLRADTHSIVGSNLSPRLGANYRIDDTQFFRATLSQGYRLPVPLEGYLDQNFYIISPELDVETVSSINFGWQKYYNEGEQRYRMGLDLFYNRAKKPSFFIPLSASEMETNWTNWALAGNPQIQPGPFFEYQNINNPSTVLGTELTGAYFANSMNTEFWLNITYQKFQYDNDIIYQSDGFANAITGGDTFFQFDQNLGDAINGPPDWKISTGSTWERNGWHLSAAVRYASSREVFSFAASQWRTRDKAATAKLPAYTALDIALGYNWGQKDDLRRSLKISIMDLFDTDHFEVYAPNNQELTDSGENQHTSQIGRNMTLAFQWTF